MRLPPGLVAAVIEPAWDLYERSVRLRTYRRLLRSQWLPAERLQRLRQARLRRLVSHAAATSPLYRERFAAAGIDSRAVRDIEDLRDLPLLTKHDVRSRLPEILSRRYRRRDLVPAKTGGSTGVALQVYCDRRGVQMRAGAALRADSWAGWRLGEPVAAVWGNPPRPRTWRHRLRRAVKDRVFYLDTMKIDDEAIDRFIADWERWRPGLLYGHAHSIFILAEELTDRAVRLRPHGIVATSMMLIESERAVIEEVFGVPVTNRYGCEEVSLIGCECEVHQGMHLNAEHVWVEVLQDDGWPAPAGRDGRIVVTELVNFGMPMIRYEVGDRGVLSAGTCRCGRNLPLLASVTGRTADFLVAGDGSRVAGISLIENTLTALPGIRQLQLVQQERERLVANLVPGPGFGPETEAALCRRLQASLGAGCRVTVQLVAAIPREASGKYRFSICRIKD